MYRANSECCCFEIALDRGTSRYPTPQSQGGSQIQDWVQRRSHRVAIAPSVRLLPGSVSGHESGSLFNIDLETGIPWDWDSNLDLSGLGELPFADVDLQTNLDSDYQNPVASTVQASSDLEPSRDTGFPLEIGLGLGNPVDGDSDVYLSGSRAWPFVNSDLQTEFDFDNQNSIASTLPVSSHLELSREKEFPRDIGLEIGDPVDEDLNAYLSEPRALPFAISDFQTKFALDHQHSSPPNLLAPSDLVPSRKDDFRAWCNNSSRSSQPGTVSNSPSAPFASKIELPNEQTLSPLPTNVGPSISHPDSQAPHKPESLPLPPAPNLRCQTAPGSSRLDSASSKHPYPTVLYRN